MRNKASIGLLLIAVTLAVFWQVGDHEFVALDDDIYVTENRHVQAGLSSQSVTWAFTTTHAGFWIPLTWLSLMLDFELYGLNAGGYHLTNLLFHIANTLLLFLVLTRMTGAIWRSAFVATLFAIHPLHVESVAWVTERKDVLSTFFWMLTIWTYVRYAERPGVKWYLLTILSFGLGLMAKPMLVTLPFVLLLLDFWPLERFRLGQLDTNTRVTAPTYKTFKDERSPIFRLFWEKAPFFLLATASSVVTFLIHQSAGATKTLGLLPVKIRIANSLVSYVKYFGKTIWPQRLAVFYPHPLSSIPMWQVAGAGLLLGFVSILVIRGARRYPYLAVGWLWYLGTLVPVIGLVQAGEQALADRFTYVPLIGLFIMIAWGFPDLLGKWRHRKLIITVTAGVLIAAASAVSWAQLHHWKNTITLFQRALKVTSRNYLAHNNLGYALSRQGKMAEAIPHYVRALDIQPDYAMAHNNLGNALAGQGKTDEAIVHYTKALQINPDFAGAHNNLANVLEGQGKIKEAVFHFSRALEIKPDFAEVHFNLGNTLARQGKLDEAQEHFARALEHRSEYAEAYNSLGVILARKGRLDEAIVYFNEALRLKPGFLQAQNNLKIASREARKLDETRKNNRKP